MQMIVLSKSANAIMVRFRKLTVRGHRRMSSRAVLRRGSWRSPRRMRARHNLTFGRASFWRWNRFCSDLDCQHRGSLSELNPDA